MNRYHLHFWFILCIVTFGIAVLGVCHLLSIVDISKEFFSIVDISKESFSKDAILGDSPNELNLKKLPNSLVTSQQMAIEFDGKPLPASSEINVCVQWLHEVPLDEWFVSISFVIHDAGDSRGNKDPSMLSYMNSRSEVLSHACREVAIRVCVEQPMLVFGRSFDYVEIQIHQFAGSTTLSQYILDPVFVYRIGWESFLLSSDWLVAVDMSSILGPRPVSGKIVDSAGIGVGNVLIGAHALLWADDALSTAGLRRGEISATIVNRNTLYCRSRPDGSFQFPGLNGDISFTVIANRLALRLENDRVRSERLGVDLFDSGVFIGRVLVDSDNRSRDEERRIVWISSGSEPIFIEFRHQPVQNRQGLESRDLSQE